MIPYGRQSISNEDIEAVVNVLKSDFITQGEKVPAFEQALTDYVGARYGTAVNSGTSALHLACLALELSAGDYLWTSPISFAASANCALYCGASVDFVDVCRDNPLLDAVALEAKLVQAEKSGKLPKIVVAVHYAGQSCDMQTIHQLAQRYQFRVIEDACHALGGGYQQERIGNCKYSDVTIFSFHPVKSITTGEGGMAVSNQKDLDEKMKLLRGHGITRNQKLMTADSEGDWYYQQVELGFNYRMTDIHAALGISQLKRLDTFIDKRRRIAERYDTLLKPPPSAPWALLPKLPDCESAHHLYPVRITNENEGGNRAAVFKFMRDQDIGVNVHYIPIYKHPYYKKYPLGECPNAEKYYAEAISLPIYPDLRETEQLHVAETFKRSFE